MATIDRASKDNATLLQILSRDERIMYSLRTAACLSDTYPSAVHSNTLFRGTIDKNWRVVPKSAPTYFFAVILELVLLLTTYIPSNAVSTGILTVARSLEMISVAICRAKDDVPPT